MDHYTQINFKMISIPKINYSLLLRITISAIFLQTLYYKFNAHPDSIYIFSKLGVEPYGRIGLGIIELVISIFLLFPKSKYFSIVFSILILIGAIMSHIFIIGISINGDNGKLFFIACFSLLLALILFLLHFKEMKKIKIF